MEEFNFNKEVVELSFQKPVLLDFWAEWCGPCKILGPVLEEMEIEDAGKWALVKINTEHYPDIAEYFRIQSIPNCKLIFEGKIVGEFTGAQSKTVIRKWIDEHLNKLIVEEVEVLSDNLNEILSQETTVPDKNFLLAISDYVQGHSDDQKALVALLRHEVFYHPSEAIKNLDKLQEEKLRELYAQQFETIKEFLNTEFDESINTGNQLKQARSLLLQGDGPACIEIIIDVLNTDPKFDQEIARRTGIALFTIWGSQYSVTKEYRKLFDMAIW